MNVAFLHQALMLANYPILFLKASQAFTLSGSVKNNLSERSLKIIIDKASGHKSQINAVSPIIQVRTREYSIPEDILHQQLQINESLQSELEEKEYLELERRRKIGLANKGRTPWNKGQKHKAETRELIRKRTIEALRDPKVRQKMSVSPRVHSAQSKAKIGSSLRKLWEGRIQHKKLQEKCYYAWSTTIAEAARMGCHGQVQLKWDSYDRLKADILMQRVQWKAEKARVKELALLKAKNVAVAKAEKMARLVQQKKEREMKVRAREYKKATKRVENGKELASLKLKAKSTKLLTAPVSACGTGSEVQADVKKWDLEFIQKEKMRLRISFADQIRAAKISKGNLVQGKF